jgi:hypothetical protein
VSAEAARWAIRLFLGREPVDQAEVELHRNHATLEALRRGFAETAEWAVYMRAIRRGDDYRVPFFLLAPPADPRIPWAPAPPSLAAPVSQLCTAAQLDSAEFIAWCRALDLTPNLHRKTWEFCWIGAVIEAAGLLRPGCRALGFGVGQEPLPAMLAARGLNVLATDAPAELIAEQGWAEANQHAASLDALDRPNIVPRATLAERVAFRAVDMNAIPADLEDFDLCWSACALEHLGSLEHGLRFIEASLGPLRPGGLAVHTTEFNLESNEQTFEDPGLSLYRRQDIERLLSRLLDAGHRCWPLNLHPGDREIDAHVDAPPYALPHLKLEIGRYVSSSLGIVVQKAG